MNIRYAIFLTIASLYFGTASAQSLKATIITAGNDPISTHAVNFLNQKFISKLSIKKDIANGTLIINVHFSARLGNSFLVRLFDRNGNYLTHFETQCAPQLFSNAPLGQEGGSRQLIFPVNIRDLRDAEMAEFGALPLTVNTRC